MADGPALTLYCECYSKWLRARGEVPRHGLLIKSTTDVIKKGKIVATKELLRANPAVNIEIQMARMMKEFLIEFGLTPSSRSRIQLDSRGDRRMNSTTSSNGRPDVQPDAKRL